MDYGRKDFFIAADTGFRENVSSSWFEGFKANVAYKYQPISTYTDEQNLFGEVERDALFTRDRFVQRMQSIPESHKNFHETLARAKNDDHFDFLVGAVSEELLYKQEAANAPITAQFASELTDISNLALFIPALNQVRVAKTGVDAFKTAAKFGFGAGVASETIRAPFAYADSDWESAANVGMTTVFSGALGSSAHYLKPFIKSAARKASDFANGRPVQHTFDKDGNIVLAGDDGYVGQSGGDFDAVTGNPLGSPSQRILSDKNVPQEVKGMFHALTSNASVSVQGNRSGMAQQSVAMRIVPFYGTYMRVQRDLRDLHAQQITGEINATAPSIAGAYTGSSKDYDDWLGETISRMVLSKSDDPRLVRGAQDGMTRQQADAIVQLDQLFKQIDDDANFTGVFKRNEELKARIDNLNKELEELNTKDKSIRGVDSKGAKQGISKAQFAALDRGTDRIAKIKKEIDDLNAIIKKPTRQDFAFPIFYNKDLLMADEMAREGLTQKFEAHYIRERAAMGPDETMPSTTPREDAERTLARILQEDADDFENLQVDFAGGSKHLRNRKTNIPVHEVMDYIIKDEDALYSYIDRMGKKIAFAESYGGKNIKEVLTDIETSLRKKGGFTEERIARILSDFYGDYERVMGSFVRRPDRLDNQAVKAARTYTGLVYLPYAGYSAITDVGSIALAHGVMPTLKAAWSGIRDMGYTSKVFRQINMAGEVLDITRNVVSREILSDNVKRIKPNMVEKTSSIANKVFYTMNGLAPITVAGKTLDQILVQDKFFKLSRKMAAGKINKFDAEFMARYGIDQEMAEYIAKMPVERHPSADFHFSATDKWPQDTPQARRVLRTYQAAIDAHANNTIIMATTFDKPQFMDGLLYMKDNSFFQQARKLWPESFKIEDRVSTAGQKMVRMDSQLMTLPFTFMNFAFGANNKIVNVLRDPNRLHNAQGVIALLGMSYLSLEMKDKAWWRGADSVETVARVVDHSGLLGIYTDLGYMGLSMGVNSGMIGATSSPIPPKYIDPDINNRFGNFVTEPFGAPVGLAQDMYRVAREYSNGNNATASKDLFYTLPFIGLPYIAGTARDLWNAGR